MKRELTNDKEVTFRLNNDNTLEIQKLTHKFYVLHLINKAVLPQSVFLFINEKFKLLLFQEQSEILTIYDYTYYVFETHTIRFQEKYVCDIIIELDDEYRPKIDMNLFWVRQFNRYKHLSFFPPDLDLKKLNLNINLREISPRCSLAIKSKSSISGTKAYTLVGFFVPSKIEDPDWKYDVPKIFTKAEKDRMQNGVDLEDVAIYFYLMSFGNTQYSQIGWCKAPQLPHGSGALPDGLIYDPDAEVSEEILNWYPTLNRKQGVMEVKCSEKYLFMEAYYYPQIYMEMISAGTMWCDLVRFQKTVENVKNRWITRYRTRIYRIYRHKEIEKVLVTLLKYAYSHREKLQDIIMEQQFVDFRNFLTELASIEPYKEITSNEEFHILIEQYQKYKTKKIQESLI